MVKNPAIDRHASNEWPPVPIRPSGETNGHRTGTTAGPSRGRQEPDGTRGRIPRVQIGMLGPFEVRTDDGVLVDVPGARLRRLLVALALEPDRAVPKATLVDWIWGEHPPSDAVNALQRLASRLRKALPD